MEWATANNGGSEVLGYQMTVKNTSDGFEWMAYDGTGISSVTSQEITGLIEGIWYQFKVRAINKVGPGEYSPYSVSFISAQLPGIPYAPVREAFSST